MPTARSLLAVTLLALVSLIPGAGTSALAAGTRASTPAGSTNGTYIVGGTMRSTVTLTMKGAISIGDPDDMHWQIPMPQTVSASGYRETITSDTLDFSVRPASITNTVDDNGHPVREAVWNPAPAHTVVTLTETLRLSLDSDLSPFHSHAPYPLGSVPNDVGAHFLFPTTSYLQLPNSSQVQRVVDQLKRGAHTEQQVVNRVANWVRSHVNYQPNPQRFDATTVWNKPVTNCRGYDDLMQALLRKLGIPSQAENGWVSAVPFNVPVGHGNLKLSWSVPGTQGEGHTWINIYFPDAGWVPFDPQQEKFFVDPRHFALFSNVDASNPGFTYYGDYTNDNQSVTGRPLRNGIWVENPGDGTIDGQVRVVSQDSFSMRYLGVRHDVKGVMLSR